MSGIEIEFIKRPSPQSSTANNVVDSEEEDELFQRMRDELKVEEKESSRNRIGVEKWEERINGLKGVVPSSAGGGGGERIRTTNDTLGDGPPELGELERELRRRKKREERRKKGKSGKNSTSEEEEEDSSETETETETESSDQGSDEEL